MNPPIFQTENTPGQTTLRLSGDWLRAHPAPDVLGAVRRLESGSRLVIEAESIDNWDSSLLQSAAHIREITDDAGITLDENWPSGLLRLLSLAEALPSQTSGQNQQTTGRSWLGLFSPVAACQAIGRELFGLAEFIGALASSGLKLSTAQARVRLQDLLDFSIQTGPNALPIISLTSFLVGLILGYLGAVQLQQFGAEIYVADLVTVGVLREMGPLMTAIILAGRTGAAYAAQLGTMQVNEEIDAIEILGVSPMEFLVLPRVAAVILMTPLLTLFADVLGILGGGLVSSGLGVSPLQYWSEVQLALHSSHLTVGLIKAVIFGALVGIAGCRAGLASGRDSEGVGKATTQAVVVSLVYLIVADATVNIICQLLEF